MTDQRPNIDVRKEIFEISYCIGWPTYLYRRRLSCYVIITAACLTLTLTLYSLLDNGLTSGIVPLDGNRRQHYIESNDFNSSNIERLFLNATDSSLVFDSIFASPVSKDNVDRPLFVRLNIHEDPLIKAGESFLQVRRALLAARKQIQVFAFRNSVLVLYQDPPDGSGRRSNLRRTVIFKIHEQRRQVMSRALIALGDVVLSRFSSGETIWSTYHKFINEKGLPRSKSDVDSILNILRHGEVIKVDEIDRGTQVKLQLTFTDGTLAVLKPKRVSRRYQTPDNHFYFTDVERHTAEIAAFHLDSELERFVFIPKYRHDSLHQPLLPTKEIVSRLLGFNRVPPTTGRRFRMVKEIRSLSVEDLLSTFFVSSAGNDCFRGHCKNYCDTAHAVCSENGFLEASVQLLLPITPEVTWIRMGHPYRRSYSAKHIAEWETDPDYCADSVFIDETFQSRLMLDMIDTSVFDFLMNNLDRHHLVKIEELGVNSTTFHIDQGRGFGVHTRDDYSILAPLTQCCMIRYSTLETLCQFSLDGSNSLGSKLRRAMESDPISPVLIEEHFAAINRRLSKVFGEVKQCIQSVDDIARVVIDDGN